MYPTSRQVQTETSLLKTNTRNFYYRILSGVATEKEIDFFTENSRIVFFKPSINRIEIIIRHSPETCETFLGNNFLLAEAYYKNKRASLNINISSLPSWAFNGLDSSFQQNSVEKNNSAHYLHP